MPASCYDAALPLLQITVKRVAQKAKKDFIHKLGIVLKELNESGTWLKVAKQSELVSSTLLLPMLNECQQLSKIISASVVTAKGGTR